MEAPNQPPQPNTNLEALLSKNIRELGFLPRTIQFLQSVNVGSLKDLETYLKSNGGRSAFYKSRNLGKPGLNDINAVMMKLDLYIHEDGSIQKRVEVDE